MTRRPPLPDCTHRWRERAGCDEAEPIGPCIECGAPHPDDPQPVDDSVGPVLIPAHEGPWPSSCRHGQRCDWRYLGGGGRKTVTACARCGRVRGFDDVRVNLARPDWMQHVAHELVNTGRIKGVAPMSAKRRQQAEEFSGVREAAFERDGWRCQFVRIVVEAGETVPVRAMVCDGELHPHHVWRQGQGGPDSIDNIVSLCAFHHRYVHDHVRWSRAVELLR